MRSAFRSFVLIELCILICIGWSFGQEPVVVVRAGWQRDLLKTPKTAAAVSPPARTLTVDDKNFQKEAQNRRFPSFFRLCVVDS